MRYSSAVHRGNKFKCMLLAFCLLFHAIRYCFFHFFRLLCIMSASFHYNFMARPFVNTVHFMPQRFSFIRFILFINESERENYYLSLLISSTVGHLLPTKTSYIAFLVCLSKLISILFLFV